MATRALIARDLGNGRIQYLTCEIDGYLGHTGFILQYHWTAPDKIDSLFENGPISSIGPLLGHAHAAAGWPPAPAHADFTIFERRDLKRDVSTAAEVTELNGDLMEINPYRYLHRNGEWYVSSAYAVDDSYIRLEDALLNLGCSFEKRDDAPDGSCEIIVNIYDHGNNADHLRLREVVARLNPEEWEWVIRKQYEPTMRLKNSEAVVAFKLMFNDVMRNFAPDDHFLVDWLV